MVAVMGAAAFLVQADPNAFSTGRFFSRGFA